VKHVIRIVCPVEQLLKLPFCHVEFLSLAAAGKLIVT
jgi:hypothetical protein